MRSSLLGLLLLLAGCSGGSGTPCAGYDCGYDLSTSDGVRFRNNPPNTVLDQAQMEHLIAEPYREVEICMQVVTGGPLIVAVANNALKGHGGYTYWDVGLIVITDEYVLDGWKTIVQPDGTISLVSLLRHQFVHYLLHVSGFPDDLNTAHQSPLFQQCAGVT